MKLLAVALLSMLFVTWARAITYTTIDPPGSIETHVTGISGNLIVGNYVSFNGSFNETHGFSFNGTTYTTIDYPPTNGFTHVAGVSGSTILGNIWVYNGTTFTPVSDPQAFSTESMGIDGNKIVGKDFIVTDDNPFGTSYGFIYNGSNWTLLDEPDAIHTFGQGTEAHGIGGNQVVGRYTGSDGHFHGFLYDGSAYSTLDYPEAQIDNTTAQDVEGNLVVGFYLHSFDLNPHGFIFDGSTWMTVDHPDISILNYMDRTEINGIEGNRIVGSYLDFFGVTHGFIASIPEPGSVSLLSAITTLLTLGRRRKTA